MNSMSSCTRCLPDAAVLVVVVSGAAEVIAARAAAADSELGPAELNVEALALSTLRVWRRRD